MTQLSARSADGAGQRLPGAYAAGPDHNVLPHGVRPEPPTASADCAARADPACTRTWPEIVSETRAPHGTPRTLFAPFESAAFRTTRQARRERWGGAAVPPERALLLPFGEACCLLSCISRPCAGGPHPPRSRCACRPRRPERASRITQVHGPSVGFCPGGRGDRADLEVLACNGRGSGAEGGRDERRARWHFAEAQPSCCVLDSEQAITGAAPQ